MGLKAMLGNYNFPHKRTTITIQKKSLKSNHDRRNPKKSGKIKEESKKKRNTRKNNTEGMEVKRLKKSL